MAHFAQLDENNVVMQVVVVNNTDLHDDAGQESEAIGIAFCKSLFGEDTRWVQTSYTASMRKNYAGVEYSYDEASDAFIPPQPFPSWLLNHDTAHWQPPAPMPDDGKKYAWDEETTSWVAP